MASKTYVQYYADGTYKEFSRKNKQGRKVSPKEVLRTKKLVIHLTKLEKESFKEMQKKSGFSESFYGSIVLFLGLRQLSESNNCSTQ